MSQRRIAQQPDGLKQIPLFAWIIKSNGNVYIYSGKKAGLKDAISRVEDMNAGSSVRYTQISK